MRQGTVLLTVIAVAALLLSGCASVLPTGFIYTEVKVPVSASAAGMNYSKVGTAKATSVLGIVATGDASIKTAAANGGIKNIKFVDYDAKNVLGIYGEYTTTVYGD